MNRDVELAKLILECRLAAHLSQYQLADLMGVKQMSIHRWEHGICKPYNKNLIKLISIYDEILKNEEHDVSFLNNALGAEAQVTVPKSAKQVSQTAIHELRVIQKKLAHAGGNYKKVE